MIGEVCWDNLSITWDCTNSNQQWFNQFTLDKMKSCPFFSFFFLLARNSLWYTRKEYHNFCFTATLKAYFFLSCWHKSVLMSLQSFYSLAPILHVSVTSKDGLVCSKEPYGVHIGGLGLTDVKVSCVTAQPIWVKPTSCGTDVHSPELVGN